MKRILVFAGLTAVLCGCSSNSSLLNKNEVKPCAMTPLLLHVPYASLDADAQQARIVEEMRALGLALKAYKSDHKGQLPPSLTTLVTEEYIPVSALISCADPSCGKEGGVPDKYAEWGQAMETDEAGSSYLYEFSGVECKWEWQSYLGGNPSAADMDTNKDGLITWAEVKSWHMAHGDSTQQPKSGPYPANCFPVVRCYWYQYPDAYTPEATARVVLSLAADLETVFISQAWWEKDPGK
ncbi:MAG: hypothetical protein PF904_10560 [Kiritimatiellae bacterium]|jgi:hypothetical protein|nr:hypothetical protein [Kiritimatiellia bacterium]